MDVYEPPPSTGLTVDGRAYSAFFSRDEDYRQTFGCVLLGKSLIKNSETGSQQYGKYDDRTRFDQGS